MANDNPLMDQFSVSGCPKCLNYPCVCPPTHKRMTLFVSTANEGTEAPWWLIIDPQQLLRSNDPQAVYEVASMIHGPFFSRASAQAHLHRKRHAFGKNAVVFCASGYASQEYHDAWRDPDGY